MDSVKRAVAEALAGELAQVSRQVDAVVGSNMFSSDKIAAVERLSQSRDRIVAALEAVSRPS